MQIQNEKFDSQKLDSQNIGEQVNDGQVSGNNDWQHSSERWRQLEKLSAKGPAKPSLRGPGFSREIKVFLGGGLVTYAFLCACQYGTDFYYQNLPAITQSPLAVSARAAIARVTLHAEKSLLTGIVDPETLTASLYWNIDLKNTSGTDQEAQAELKLPPGAVVSRATLWVNGVPQEAAFSTTGQVTNAYNWVTVSHRDPLLVTYKDDHTVLIKASPVPANGDVMKIRLGITAPLTLGSDGQGVLTVPELKQANFALAEKNEIHLESKRSMQCSSQSVEHERTLAGKHLLTASLPADALAKLTIACPDVAGSGNFSVRATHSLPGTYIHSRLPADVDGESTILERSKSAPAGRVVMSEAAAHRVSTLWAAREVSRLLSENRSTEAQDLAAVYRIVSPISGAVVLEMESDYRRNGLNRDQYMLSVPGRRAIASKFPQPATAAGTITPFVVNGQTVSNAAPFLQGVTNGTIAPAGPLTSAASWMVASSRDANLFGGEVIPRQETLINGFNTAGTVRVNKLANLEAVLNILASAGDVGFIIAALYFAHRGLRKMKSSGFKDGFFDLVLASSLAFCGTLWLVALPFFAIHKMAKYAGKKLTQSRCLPGGANA